MQSKNGNFRLKSQNKVPTCKPKNSIFLVHKFASAQVWIVLQLVFSDAGSNYPLTDIVKAGGCGVLMSHQIANVEWKNQIVDGKSYFHTFSFKGFIDALPKEYYAFEHSYWNWVLLKHNPYIPIFKEKILRTAETGLNQKFWSLSVPFKMTDDEPIEPLKLEHFYFIFIGIAVSLMLAIASFIVERLKGGKKCSNTATGSV